MTDKQINKWLRRQCSAVGWVLIGYYVLMNLLVMLGMGLDAASQMLWSFAAGVPGDALDWDRIYANAWGYVAAILTGIALLHAWKGGGYWKDTVLHKEKRMKISVFFCLVVFSTGLQLVNSLWVSILELVMNSFGRSLMPMLEGVSGSSDTFSMFLYASILAPIGEEILFRGYILRALQPFGKRFAIWGSAILFGLFHGNLLQTPYAILMGLILGYLAVEYSVKWAILLHMFNNLVLADFLTRLTAPLSDAAYGMVNLLLFGGCFAVSVGILVKKKQEIRAYRRGEWIDRRVLKCFFTNTGILAVTVMALVNMISFLVI